MKTRYVCLNIIVEGDRYCSNVCRYMRVLGAVPYAAECDLFKTALVWDRRKRHLYNGFKRARECMLADTTANNGVKPPP